VRGGLPAPARGAFDRAGLAGATSFPSRVDLTFAELAAALAGEVERGVPEARDALLAELDRRGVLPPRPRIRAGVFAEPLASATRLFAAPGTAQLEGRARVPGVVQVRVALPAGIRRVRVRFDAGRVAGSPFVGRADAVFRPVVAASFDAPLEWRDDGSAAAGTVTPAEPISPRAYEAVFPAPNGASEIHVQIANDGDADGVIAAIVVDEGEDAEDSDVAMAASGSSCAQTRGCASAGGAGTLALALALAAALAARMLRRASPIALSVSWSSRCERERERPRSRRR
jgi:hypothetical protein